MQRSLAEELVALGLRSGLDAVGMASAEPFGTTRRCLESRRAAGLHGGMAFTYRDPARSTNPELALPGARSLVVGARSYHRAEPTGSWPGAPPIATAAGGEVGPPAPAPPAAEGAGSSPPPPRAVPLGRVARYSWRDHYEPLRAALGAVAGRLRAEGWQARVLVDDNSLVDKEAAYRAGLGWYGKNTLLLLPGRGSWFVLGSVVTDAPLPPAPAPVADGCRSCARCLPACPTGALVAPGILDANRCLAWLLEAPGPFPADLRPSLGGRVYGCDDCQEACPANRTAARRRPPPPAGPTDEPWVDLVELLAEDDSSLLARFGRWYVPRRQARYLRRNALVALGNVGDGAEPGVAGALVAALAHSDPLVRAHAVWATARLGRSDLLVAMARDEGDAGVLAELEAAGAVAAGAADQP